MDNNELAIFKDLKSSGSGFMILEGHTLLERLYQSGRSAHLVVCVPEAAALVEDLVAGTCPVHVLDQASLEELTGFAFHRGVLAAAPIPALGGMADFLESRRREAQPYRRILICPHLGDPANLGTMYRNAAAFGWDAVLMGRRCTSPFSRKALRVSMGASLKMPGFFLDGPADLELLKQAGYLTIGTVLDENALPLESLVSKLTEQDKGQGIALLIGHEYEGLSDDWTVNCKLLATIPMAPGHDSLNAGLAGGIFMYRLAMVP